MSLLQLAFDLFNGVQRHTHDDEDARTSEGEVLIRMEGNECERRDHRNEAQVQGPRCRQPRQHIGQVVLGGLPGPDAGNESTILLHVVTHLDGIESDGHVEVAEEDDQQEIDDVVNRVITTCEVVTNPLRRVGLRSEGGVKHRKVQNRRGEDDRDDAGLVHLQRNVGRRAAEHPAPDHPLRILHRDAPLALLDEDNGCHDEQADGDHRAEHEPGVGLAGTVTGNLDGPQGIGEAGSDLGEDHDRHAIADTVLGDELTHPHDDRRACRHRQDHDDDLEDRGGVHDRQGAAGEQTSRGCQGDEGRRLQQAEHQGEVTGVLGDLVLAGRALLLEGLQLRDDDGQQLQDDRRRNVGHDAEREDRQLQQGATREQADHRVQTGRGPGTRLADARVDVRHVDVRDGDDGPEPENRQDEEREQDLAAKIRRSKGIGEGGKHPGPLPSRGLLTMHIQPP